MINQIFFRLCRVSAQTACLTALLWCCPALGAVSIIDDAGQTITLAKPATRIIPLYAGLAETLTAMGLQDRIVGRTASDDTLLQQLPVIGTHMRPNPELIVGLAPDLVIQLEGREEAGATAQTLTRHGIATARFRINSFDNLYSCILRLGILTGSEDTSQELIASLKKRIEVVRQQQAAYTTKPSVFFEVRYPNLLGAGGSSMLTDIINAAGGKNILSAYPERMVRLSEETLFLQSPDIYLIQQGPMNKNPIPLDQRPNYRNLRAQETGFVFIVPEACYSRPGPQSVNSIEHLAKHIDSWHKANASQHSGTALPLSTAGGQAAGRH